MWRFAKAVLLGALASAAAPLVLTIGVAILMLGDIVRGDRGAWDVLYFAILPLRLALPVVFGAALVIGLPTAAFLKWRRQETREAYTSIGIIAGAIIPLIFLVSIRAPSGYWIALCGALGGGTTAFAWWSGRATTEGP